LFNNTNTKIQFLELINARKNVQIVRILDKGS